MVRTENFKPATEFINWRWIRAIDNFGVACCNNGKGISFIKKLFPHVHLYQMRKLTGTTRVYWITVSRNTVRINSSSSRMLIQDAFHANGWDFRSSPVKNRGEQREGARKGERKRDYLTNIWEQLDVCSSVTVFTWFAVSRPLEMCLWPLAICTKEVLVKCVTSSHGFLNPPIS